MLHKFSKFDGIGEQSQTILLLMLHKRYFFPGSMEKWVRRIGHIQVVLSGSRFHPFAGAHLFNGLGRP